MEQANPGANGVLRLFSEVLLAGTLASAFLTRLINSNEIRWSAQFFGWEMGFNHTFNRSHGDYLGENLAFFTWVMVLTVIAVLVLRALSLVSFAERTIQRVSGAVAVAAPPVCLWLVERYRLHESQPFRVLLGLEASAAVMFALLCAWSRRTIPLPITAVVLALHCAFWLSLFSDALEPFAFCWKTVPIIAYFSAVTSAYYVGRCRLR
jgi:hypothetical protein